MREPRSALRKITSCPFQSRSNQKKLICERQKQRRTYHAILRLRARTRPASFSRHFQLRFAICLIAAPNPLFQLSSFIFPRSALRSSFFPAFAICPTACANPRLNAARSRHRYSYPNATNEAAIQRGDTLPSRSVLHGSHARWTETEECLPAYSLSPLGCQRGHAPWTNTFHLYVCVHMIARCVYIFYTYTYMDTRVCMQNAMHLYAILKNLN